MEVILSEYSLIINYFENKMFLKFLFIKKNQCNNKGKKWQRIKNLLLVTEIMQQPT